MRRYIVQIWEDNQWKEFETYLSSYVAICTLKELKNKGYEVRLLKKIDVNKMK